jgi:2-polyprenyl-3-methyl-5-hydroxy-6-metoxy-1,4-benzoquinol methylase
LKAVGLNAASRAFIPAADRSAADALVLVEVNLADEPNKQREIESAALSADEPHAQNKPFGMFWGSHYFTKWAAISHSLSELGLAEGSTILDVGMGTGWTTVFLAETGFRATGVDIAPASVELGRRRAERAGVEASFAVADMDTLDMGETYDAVLVFDALHHSSRQREVVRNVADHLKPGGWVLFGEPSWLHSVSSSARRTSKDLGWIERGISVRELKSDCRKAELGDFRRFYEGTSPFSPSVGRFLWELGRLVGAQVNISPRTSVWLAARRLALNHAGSAG